MQTIAPANQRLKFLLIVMCVLILAITLGAGLWPFSIQMNNEVWWIPNENGLYLGEHGMLISGGKFSGIPLNRENGYSIEIWLKPGLTSDSSTILSFFEPGSSEPLRVRQSANDLAFTRFPTKTHGTDKQKNAFLDGVFQEGKKVFITFVSRRGNLEIYLDGVLKKTLRNTEIRGDDFTGILIVGNSPYGNLSWVGTFQGLAFYDRALTREETQHNYVMWQGDRKQLAQGTSKPYSLYLFDEQSGVIVHNLGRVGPDLVIPTHYFKFQRDFLTPFWKEFQPNRGYVKDIAINIFGLVPLGFSFAALFAWLRNGKQILLSTMIWGFCISLTIEVFQAFIPTRYSGTTDLITNTMGTALGAWLYLNNYVQTFAKRLGLIRVV